MSLNLSRKKGSIHTTGGGWIRIMEVNEDGTEVNPRAVYDLGYLANTSVLDKTDIELIEDETGEVVKRSLSKRENKVLGTLQQTDKAVLDMVDEVPNKFYRLVKYNGTVNTKNQEIYYGIGQISPIIDLKFKGGTTPFEYVALINENNITIDSTSLSLFGAYASTPVTISARKYKTVVET